MVEALAWVARVWPSAAGARAARRVDHAAIRAPRVSAMAARQGVPRRLVAAGGGGEPRPPGRWARRGSERRAASLDSGQFI